MNRLFWLKLNFLKEVSLSLTYADEVSLGLWKVGLSQLSENWSIWLFVHRVYKNSPSYILMKKFKWKKQHVCLCLIDPWRFYFATSKNKTFRSLAIILSFWSWEEFLLQVPSGYFFILSKNKPWHSSLHFL